MKTVNIKRIIILLGSALLYLNLSAQELNDPVGKKKMCDGYMTVPYVFEGKIDSTKYFTIKTGEHTYANFNAYLVEVKKVIKGNIQKGTIEILEYAPGVTYKGEEGTRLSQCDDCPGPPTRQGVYFCLDKNYLVPYSHYANSNGKSLLRHGEISVTSDGKIQKESLGISLYFSTLADFYNYLSANCGVKIEQ